MIFMPQSLFDSLRLIVLLKSIVDMQTSFVEDFFQHRDYTRLRRPFRPYIYSLTKNHMKGIISSIKPSDQVCWDLDRGE